MEEFRLFLNLQAVAPERRSALRDALRVCLQAFADQNQIGIVTPQDRSEFDCPADNNTLTSGWRSRRSTAPPAEAYDAD